VSQRDPTHQRWQSAIDSRRENHVPVILHPLVSDQINREFLQALGNQSLECFLVGVLEKDRLPRIATIQGVINGACFVSTWWSRHERGLCPDH
jgi:hypothetical protein